MKKKMQVFTGPIRINMKGVGFFDIEPEDKKSDASIEIQPAYVNRALHGDIVEVTLTGETIRNRRQGKVVKIIKRAKEEFVGEVIEKDGKMFVLPDDKRLYVDIRL